MYIYLLYLSYVPARNRSQCVCQSVGVWIYVPQTYRMQDRCYLCVYRAGMKWLFLNRFIKCIERAQSSFVMRWYYNANSSSLRAQMCISHKDYYRWNGLNCSRLTISCGNAFEHSEIAFTMTEESMFLTSWRVEILFSSKLLHGDAWNYLEIDQIMH